MAYRSKGHLESRIQDFLKIFFSCLVTLKKTQAGLKASNCSLQPAAVSKMLILTFMTQHESKHTLHMQSTFGF